MTACQAPVDSGQLNAPAAFVGSDVCATCHEAEYAAWASSHHKQAMQAASADTVLGDFGSASLEHRGITSTFFERDGEFRVRTDGPDGALQDYRISHTFGVEPLQQYLLEFRGGRLQALSVAWDSRDVADGGQRWFHLYPNQRIDNGDPLHWTAPSQRWNTMCAECHSTNLVKGYDARSDQFSTSFAEVSVGCEACHGPSSAHVMDPSVPVTTLASERRTWVFDEGTSIAHLATEPAGRPELETCAQCHARRVQLSDDYTPGMPFLDSFRPMLLDAGLYHADGQILDEVFVYGSFLQSAMAAAGVTCSDCHDPHTATLRADGNAVCTRCHLSSAFDAIEHHHHAPGTAGAQCVACHMRSETYMVVDPRRDHSFRVPRPDLADRIGSPDACSDCHADQEPVWAAEQIAAWFPGGRHNEAHYGDALYAGRHWSAEAPAVLGALVEDRAQPAIVRATALELLALQLDEGVTDLIRRALNDSEPLVRLAAIGQLTSLPAATRAQLAPQYLTNPLRPIRIAAARALAEVWESLDARYRQDFSVALAEYIAVQEFNSDLGSGLTNLGNLAVALENPARAEGYFRVAIERDPAFVASYLSLADLYRSQGREDESRATLASGLELNPDDAGLNLALGLALTRVSMPREALERIRLAAANASADPHYAYVLGIALNSMGSTREALEVLRSAHERFPRHRDTLVALATILRDSGDFDEALRYARSLLALMPSDNAARALVAELEAMAGI